MFLSAADANRSDAMTFVRANNLAHAARASSSEEAVSMLETALNDPIEARTAASTILYLHLLEAHRAIGNQLAAAQIAEQFWRDRGPNGASFAVLQAGLTPDDVATPAAAICYSAATLARQRNQLAEANLWYQRVLEVAPNSVTARTVRQILANP